MKTNTGCIRRTCKAAIPPRSSERRLKLPDGVSSREVKRDEHTKKRRIRNGAPKRREHVDVQYVQAKEVYVRAAGEAKTACWKRFCSSLDGEILWDGIYRIIRKTRKKREDVLLQTDSGRVLGPGIDGFTSDICQAAIFRDLEFFLAMANKCLILEYFPWTWKVAAIKVIPKSDKDNYSRPNSYRPIGLLRVLDRIVERMLSGMEDALYDLIQDREWNPEKGTFKGSIQGYISGPTFWNLILNSLLQELGELGVYVQAFANDVFLMFSGQSISSIEEEANRTLACVHCWGVRNKLRFAPPKTDFMVLVKKLKYEEPVVQMNGKQISLVGEIHLLGLTIDKKLTFNPHLAKASKKAANIYKGLARTTKATWDLNLQVVRTTYITLRRARLTVDFLHSALILSRLFPLDIRVKEATWLYKNEARKRFRGHFCRPGA
ncbi:Retrovirus-related Pol polyprotein from type-1 retrotransposable element R1 [Eumeta japonica]|uniref:Retrovirus-related Pol polyprotein from type-1 retrotransposable element R1 n=1 Tax=Eumeta variegata TaxID=151549 RepID=A0A4C1YFS5_EUMVA|nr:Retrovirus-related Pol polyprotein from type-1 retrotransposable element R1 [Eumeta japonica]